MKKIVIKIFTVFLLLTSCMPVLFTIFFLCKQQLIRHEMKEKLEKEFLQTITITSDKVAWAEYNKEIFVGNKLFDVHSFSEKDGLYFFIGLFDEEETALNESLEKENEGENENELLAQLFQCLQAPCVPLSFDYGKIADQNNTCFFPILLHTSSPYLNIPTPPPQA